MMADGIPLAQECDGWLSAVRREPQFLMVLRLTSLLIMIHGYTSQPMRPALHVLCGATLLVPHGVLSRALWWLIAAVTCAGTLLNWEIIDNHNFLIAYMSIVAAAAQSVDDGERYVRLASRIMVATVFGLAVGWKLAAGEYLNGSFFYFTVLTDGRFQDVAALASGLTLDQVREFATSLRALTIQTGDVSMIASPRLMAVSLWMSWLTLAIESAIAAAFTVWSTRLGTTRHVLLWTFVATTYWLMPVTGFAWALLVLGFAQCGVADRRCRVIYLVLLGVVQFTELPWRTYLGIGI
jgi:hypothetical protein